MTPSLAPRAPHHPPQQDTKSVYLEKIPGRCGRASAYSVLLRSAFGALRSWFPYRMLLCALYRGSGAGLRATRPSPVATSLLGASGIDTSMRARATQWRSDLPVSWAASHAHRPCAAPAWPQPRGSPASPGSATSEPGHCAMRFARACKRFLCQLPL
jgi:hypothetical protein